MSKYLKKINLMEKGLFWLTAAEVAACSFLLSLRNMVGEHGEGKLLASWQPRNKKKRIGPERGSWRKVISFPCMVPSDLVSLSRHQLPRAS